MEKYLCINTITAIKVEMAQCLYLQATIALFSELDFTQEQEIEGFIEDSYDAQQITLQSIIDEIDYINKKKRNYEMISESNTEIEMEQNHINESTNISNEFQELGNIQNPLKAKTKGRPPTKRYRSSIEHEKGESSKSGCSSRNTYKCLICGQCGHNAAYHKNDKLKERQQ
ncbi:uncharacterized protein OCT59_008636 [Rhizophagus irregularis]|uniref:uncharacterized protein n=1 Tax=Rhizophagus irregularis TaxID=588596 RepID=UPI00332ED7CB|nr:hypothetical protein OCT59_008636 [Rhizophagus irregularis]